MSDLIDSWGILSASIFSILQYIAFFQVYEESLTLLRYAVRKEKNILIACLISMYQNLTGVSFLKLQYGI